MEIKQTATETPNIEAAPAARASNVLGNLDTVKTQTLPKDDRADAFVARDKQGQVSDKNKHPAETRTLLQNLFKSRRQLEQERRDRVLEHYQWSMKQMIADNDEVRRSIDEYYAEEW